MSEEENKEEQLFVCADCGFHYKTKELADECERGCREDGMCNSEITAQSIERQKKD